MKTMTKENMRERIAYVEKHVGNVGYVHFRHYDKITRHPRGAVTVAYHIDHLYESKGRQDEYVVVFAASCCSPVDNFNKVEARLRAIRRLSVADKGHNPSMCNRITFYWSDTDIKGRDREAYILVKTCLQQQLKCLSWYKGIWWDKS